MIPYPVGYLGFKEVGSRRPVYTNAVLSEAPGGNTWVSPKSGPRAGGTTPARGHGGKFAV